MNIDVVCAFSDNYIWILENNDEYVVVDPGSSDEVLKYLEGKKLSAIILTHFHDDHTGGVSEILKKYKDIDVYGPIETSDLNTKTVVDKDEFSLIGKNFKVIKTSGHTKEHISYLCEDKLFCGDSLFLAGCGRVFTGDYKALYDAFETFKKLPEKTLVYPAHEYSKSNLEFARTIFDNRYVEEEYNRVLKLRGENKITIPTTIGKEKKINPFMNAKNLDEFIDFRNKKDNF